MSKPIKYGASWKSNAILSANVAVGVFPAELNERGAVVWVAKVNSYASAGWTVPVMIAKNGVPSNIVDGDVIMSGGLVALLGASYSAVGELEKPIFIPAGKGLYFINKVAELEGLRHVLYGLL